MYNIILYGVAFKTLIRSEDNSGLKGASGGSIDKWGGKIDVHVYI